MEFLKGVKVIDGLSAIFVEKLNAIVIADLHLGYELALAEKGVFVPQTQLKEIISDLKEIFKKFGGKDLIINGDLKHEFGEASAQEWREVRELVKFLKEKVERIVLVRGNHDNYLLNIVSKIGIELHDPYYLSNGVCFLHGHKRVKLPEFETLIIAHEHPSLVLKEGFEKIKVRCLLYGETTNKKDFICLPAFSYWAYGTEVNLIPKEELLSPILRDDSNFENLVPIALDKETGPLKFPPLKKLCYWGDSTF